MERDWRTLYHLFQTLFTRYVSSQGNPEVGRQVFLEAINPLWSFAQVDRKVRDYGLCVEFSADWNKLQLLRDAFYDLGDYGFNPETPAASVYQTAIQVIQLRLNNALDREGEQRWFYRGQRCSKWSTIPSMFRGLEPVENAEDQFLARRARVRWVVRAVENVGLGADEFEALATTQHYSKELGVSTWLLDVTMSPFVALFFASDGGKDGDVGVVDYIERTEWLRFSSGPQNLVGSIRYVAPSGIPRIENQRAFFLEAPHPELYREMVNRRLYFRQQAGVVFEDDSIEPPISRGRIYPKEDPIVPRLPKVSEGPSPVPLQWEPSVESLKEPSAAVFFSIVEPWLEGASETQKRSVSAICRLHAAVTRRRTMLPDYISTLHHLRRTVEARMDEQMHAQLGARRFLKSYYVTHIRSAEAADAFLECVAEACPEWRPIAVELLRPT